MSEWNIFKLDNIADIIDSMHITPKYTNFGVPLVRVTDLKNSYLDLSECLKVSEDTYDIYSKNHKSQIGDIIFARVGSYGNLAITRRPMKYCLGQNTTFIVPKQNPYYLYYYLISPQGKIEIEGSVSGSTQPTISLKSIKNFDIKLPCLFEQKAIASVLSSLDDKIDLLHRQNKTLESMAETLFRQWFVEEVQDDWIYKELGSVIDTSSGGTPSRKEMSFYQNGTNYWVKSKELNSSFLTHTEEMITDEAINNSSAKILPAYSVLIAMYGATVGEYALITKFMTCNQAVCAVKQNENYPYTFIFMYIKNKKDELINQAVGSAQQNISQITIKKLLIPTCYDRITEYHFQVKEYFERMQLNIEQIQTLEKLRDTLLPKLMSGEVRVQYTKA